MRPPGYEYLDRRGTGQPYESMGREAMAARRAVEIGRPRGAAARAAAQHGGQDEVSDVELQQMRLRLAELERTG